MLSHKNKGMNLWEKIYSWEKLICPKLIKFRCSILKLRQVSDISCPFKDGFAGRVWCVRFTRYHIPVDLKASGQGPVARSRA
jgi:hypothetical protein